MSRLSPSSSYTAGSRSGASRGGGRPQARRQREPEPAPPGAPRWQEWGGSKKQQEADARFLRQDGDANLAKFVARIPRIQRYADYREMLAKQKDIDALIVATPDHTHAVIASAAMDLGKHVYVQKPMCLVGVRGAAPREARRRDEGAARRWAIRATRATSTAAAWTISRPASSATYRTSTCGPTGRFWPQGLPRPKPFTADRSRRLSQEMVLQAAMGAVKGSATPPSTLAWDLFLGVAPVVEHDPIYHPFNWRGWVDWGQGALGDMGAHLIDFPVWGARARPADDRSRPRRRRSTTSRFRWRR